VLLNCFKQAKEAGQESPGAGELERASLETSFGWEHLSFIFSCLVVFFLPLVSFVVFLVGGSKCTPSSGGWL
jgi:hypothetical protein